MKNKFFTIIAFVVVTMSACTKFTDVKIRTPKGEIIQAHVIEQEVSIPKVGDSIRVIETESTDGFLYNSTSWTESDNQKNFFGHRTVLSGRVIEIIP